MQNKNINNKNNPTELSELLLCESHVSLLSKSLRLLDGEEELLSELLQASVRWQI